MPNLNGRLYAAVFLGFFTHGAFAATLLAESEWAPGANCYSDNTSYKIAVCDCIGYHGSMGDNWPTCDTNTLPSMPCRMGTKTMHFSYVGLHTTVPNCMDTNNGGSYRAVEYMCYNSNDWNTSDVCDCVDYATSWQLDATGIKYTKKTAKFQCGTYNFSTYCEYEMMDPETGQYETFSQGTQNPNNKNYVCGPTDLSSPKTEYSCVQGYYLSGTTCKDCPTAGSLEGVQLYATSPEYNTGNALRCYVPANSFSVSDDKGKWTWNENCHYSN